jgi:hypothetical protein
MSVKIAVALAATIGMGIVTSSQAEARPEMVGISGDYAPGTIVVKTHERRLYLILDSGRAMRYPVGVGKARDRQRRDHFRRDLIAPPAILVVQPASCLTLPIRQPRPGFVQQSSKSPR